MCSVGSCDAMSSVVAHELLDAGVVPSLSFRGVVEVEILCACGLVFLVEHNLKLVPSGGHLRESCLKQFAPWVVRMSKWYRRW